MGIDTPEGSYTYHYESNFYSLFECEELEQGKHWDGHTEKDVTRLLSLPSAESTIGQVSTDPQSTKTKQVTGKLDSDYISRQDAIAKLKEHRKIFCKNRLDFTILPDKDKARVDEIDTCIAALINLPPAQPEQRWISSGKKPLKEGSYLVWMPFAPPKHRMAVAEYCGGYWNIKTPISAWMPLPEPYNAERRTDGEETDRKTNHFKTVDIYL